MPNRSDVYSWGIRFDVDGAEDICVVPSTVLSHSFIMREDVCNPDHLVDVQNQKMTDEQCRSRRGGFISQSQSLPDVTTDGLKEANPNWNALGNEINAAALATFKLFDEAVTMVVGLITGGQQSTASHLGLASGSVFLQALKDNGLITALSFGLDVGSQSTKFPRRGSLVLGGYDQARFTGSSYEYNVTADIRNRRYCPVQVPVTKIDMIRSFWDNETNQLQTVNTPVTTETSGPTYCIEPCVTLCSPNVARR
jgi:hypothetical protein